MGTCLDKLMAGLDWHLVKDSSGSVFPEAAASELYRVFIVFKPFLIMHYMNYLLNIALSLPWQGRAV